MNGSDAAKYVTACVLAMMVYGLPTALVFYFVRSLFPGLSRGLSFIAAVHVVLVTAWMWAAMRNGILTPLRLAELALVTAVIVWLVLRPGRGPVITLLIYQTIGLVLTNIPVLFRNPWGSALHKAAVAALAVRTVVMGILAYQLRKGLAKPETGVPAA